MSAQVDVLAVMDAAAEWRGGFMGDFTSAAELEAARDAVAALIAERDALREALSEMTELAAGPAGGVSQAQKVAILAKARAALTTGESA